MDEKRSPIEPAGRPLPTELAAFAEARVGSFTVNGYSRSPFSSADVWNLAASGGDSYFLKHFGYSGRDISGAFTDELRFYRCWAPRLGAFTPEVVGVRQSLASRLGRGVLKRWVVRLARWRGASSSALLLSAVPGVRVDLAALTREQERAVHVEAGRFLRRLHALPCNGRVAVEDPNQAIGRRAERWAQLARGKVQDDLVAWVLKLVRQTDFAGLEYVPAHRDFAPYNWLVHVDGDGLSLYVIDFERARPDIWLQDLVRLCSGPWLGRPDLKATFFDGYGRVLTGAEQDQLFALQAIDSLFHLTFGLTKNDRPLANRHWKLMTHLRAAPMPL